MARTTSFTLGEHFDGFVARELASGRYASASEVVREALRLLEERRAKMEAVRQALVDGERSGPGRSLTRDVVSEIKARARKRAGTDS